MAFLEIHEIMPASLVNGPGIRFCIWLQGCSLACPGCFNPGTHEFGRGRKLDTEKLAGEILESASQIEGVTISGGEPLQQLDPVIELLKILKQRSNLSVVLFSGFDRNEISSMPRAEELMALTDAIIAGRYKENERLASGLLGSKNQEIVLCSQRYTMEQFKELAASELVIDLEGNISISGIDPLVLKDLIS